MNWENKFHKEYIEKVTIIDKRFGEIQPGQKMLISSPKSIYDYINNIPYGTFKTIKNMRIELAKQKNANNTCHLTTGIFLRIAIEYSIEEKNIIPFWRIINIQFPIARKLSCGLDFIAKKQTEEGINV
jgi:hypothetical protein|tara:strand:- start:64 stop:447 length:384 start_codon:yes stop_codon:yes gene_type:complete